MAVAFPLLAVLCPTHPAPHLAQVRECANALLRVAKDLGCCVFLVGHVTKGGDIAGPKVRRGWVLGRGAPTAMKGAT